MQLFSGIQHSKKERYSPEIALLSQKPPCEANHWTEIIALIAGVTGLLLCGVVPSSFHLALVGFSGCLTFALLHSIFNTFYHHIPSEKTKDCKRPYFKAAWTMSIALTCLFLSFFLALNLNDAYKDHRAFSRYKEQFHNNEFLTLVFYDHIHRKDPTSISLALDSVYIPKWRHNLQLARSMKQLTHLGTQEQQEAMIMYDYAILRIQALETLQHEITHGWDIESRNLIELHKNIEQLSIAFSNEPSRGRNLPSFKE
ncbi:hypothetical protein QLX67_05410 [Balneolaceae bacterium ANBcel3]|nr:hypothetical protein [Balneolaceae bacterium ANBcel3]